MANRERQQSTTTYPLYFLMVDSTDHLTGKTGLTPTVTLSKNGAGFGAAAGAVSEVGNGLYKVAGNATDSNTLGELWLHAAATGADPTDIAYTVVAYDPFATPVNAADVAAIKALLPTALTADGNIKADSIRVGGTSQTGRDIGASVLFSSGTGTGQLDVTAGVVKSNLSQILGTALTETSGYIAAAFKKFFNVAGPTGTVNSLPDAVPGATGGVFIAGSNAATAIPAGLTTNITGNLSGSVNSVTTAIVLPTIPTDWMGAAGISAAAVIKLQAGISTYAGGDTSGTTTLLSRVSANAALASQIPANFTGATFASAGVFATAALANAPTGSGGGGSGLDAAGVRAAVGLTTANLDTQLTGINAKTTNLPADPASNTQVNTRMASSNYTAPDNTAINAIGQLLLTVAEKTNNLPPSPAATGEAMTLTIAYDAAKAAATQTSVNAIKTVVDSIQRSGIDPLAAAVPGTYAEGTAGYALGNFLQPLIAIPGPSTAGLCGVYLYSQSIDGTIRAGVEVNFTLSAWPTQCSTGLMAETVTMYTTSTGLLSGVLVRTDDMIPAGRTYLVTALEFGLKNKPMILDDTTLVDNAFDLKRLFV